MARHSVRHHKDIVAIYTANGALVRGDDAVMARLPEVRRAEEDHAAAVLASLGKRIHLPPADLRFSGQGDAPPAGAPSTRATQWVTWTPAGADDARSRASR